jgi:hypothetical protein
MFDSSVRLPSNCEGVLVVQHRGWLWLIDRSRGLQDLVPADGLVACDLPHGEITTYRARRIDHLSLAFEPVQREQKSVASLPVTK